MKLVVFASGEDCVRSIIAATFFDAFSLPTLVRAVPVSNRSERTPSEVICAMEEIGLPVTAEPQILRAGLLEAATLIVRFGDLGTPAAVPSECWDVPLPGNLKIEHVRKVRDALRKRVWQLVARNGWYRLQPASVVASRGEHAGA